MTVTDSRGFGGQWELFGPFNATWSDFSPGDENNPSCTATGTITSPEFVPSVGSTNQYLRFENLQAGPAHFNPRVGTYTLAGPHIMIEPSESPDGCG